MVQFYFLLPLTAHDPTIDRTTPVHLSQSHLTRHITSDIREPDLERRDGARAAVPGRRSVHGGGGAGWRAAVGLAGVGLARRGARPWRGRGTPGRPPAPGPVAGGDGEAERGA